VNRVIYLPYCFSVTKDTLDKYHALLNLSSSSKTLQPITRHYIFRSFISQPSQSSGIAMPKASIYGALLLKIYISNGKEQASYYL
jgi:hypothetical protein